MLDTETTPSQSILIPPYNGRLVDLTVDANQREENFRKATKLAFIQLSPRSLCDLELLAWGAFSPLDRFVGEADYKRIVDEMRLEDGTLFPIPVALPAGEDAAKLLGKEVAVRSPNNEVVALMQIEEVFERDARREALGVLGTEDLRHPLVAEMASWGRFYVSGPLQVLNLPRHYDFPDP